MKKKLIQILMLLVVAVSVGSFVSCKDTNEDLYNELRTQYIKDNAKVYTKQEQKRIIGLSTCADAGSVNRIVVFCYILD